MPRPSTGDAIAEILREAVRASDPVALTARALRDLPAAPRRLLAVGKAAPGMAAAAREAQAGCVRGTLVVGPAPLADRIEGMSEAGRAAVEALAVDHPLPTRRNVDAAGRVVEFVRGVGAGEELLLLLSGGASACLCLPREPLTLADLAAATDALLRAGAPIEELNTVRKHCEVLKGGGLARLTRAGAVRSLILSDVIGDRLDVIGSGPTAPDPTTFADALAVLDARGLLGASPPLTALLRRGERGEEPETVKGSDPVWDRVHNRIVGSNRQALDAACACAARLGFRVLDRREGVVGEASEVGRSLARAAMAATPDACLAWGGETTVTVGDAPGIGGRNQELALAAAIEIEGVAELTIAGFATDGRDGPTDAAGAIISGTTAARIRAAGIDPGSALARHDSHNALDAGGALVRTGPTGTNVNDLMLALRR